MRRPATSASATAVDARRVKIDVCDDGRGFAVDEAESAGKAQGLAKMRRRAKAIGGDLLVMPTPDGTTLSLLSAERLKR